MTPIDVSHCARWYVLQTRPRQEARAVANLRGWGLETLAFWLREPVRARGPHSPTHRVSPLFTGYIFARFEAAVLLGKVRYTRGIRDVVGFGEYATPVEDGVIELIQSRTDADGVVQVVALQPGDKVEVVDGPMRSLSGVFERYVSQDDRVLILLTTIRAQIRVELSQACIRGLTPCTLG